MPDGEKDVAVQGMRFCKKNHDLAEGQERCWCGAKVKVNLPAEKQLLVPAKPEMCQKHPDLSIIG